MFERSIEQALRWLGRRHTRNVTRWVDDSFFVTFSHTPPDEASEWISIGRRRDKDLEFNRAMLEYWLHFNRVVDVLKFFDVKLVEGPAMLPVVEDQEDGSQSVLVDVFNSAALDEEELPWRSAQHLRHRAGSEQARLFMAEWVRRDAGSLPGWQGRAMLVGRRSIAERQSVIQTLSSGFSRTMQHVAKQKNWSLVPFTVRTQSPGYQVHFTPEFWRSPTVFGSTLSTPVHALISAGRYKFGGTVKGPIIWDAGIHEASDHSVETVLTAI